MVLLLDTEEVGGLLTPQRAVAAVEYAFRAWAGENAAEYVRGSRLEPLDRSQVEELLGQTRYPLEFAKGISYGQAQEKLERLLAEVVGHVFNGKILSMPSRRRAPLKARMCLVSPRGTRTI